MFKQRPARVISRLRGIMSSEKGQSMVESGLMIALVAIVCIVLIATIGKSLVSIFERLLDQIAKHLGIPI